MYTHGGSFQLFKIHVPLSAPLLPDPNDPNEQEAALGAAALEDMKALEKEKLQIAAEIGDSEEVHGAAAKLQAMQRKKLAKKEAERKKEEKRIAEEIGDSEEVHSAASKLQALQRKKLAKKEAQSMLGTAAAAGTTAAAAAPTGVSPPSIHTVVDLVPLPKVASKMQSIETEAETSVADSSFPGLYLDQLPKHPYVRTASGWSILCTTTWGSRPSIVMISLTDGQVRRVSPLMTAALPAPQVPTGWPRAPCWTCNPALESRKA